MLNGRIEKFLIHVGHCFYRNRVHRKRTQILEAGSEQEQGAARISRIGANDSELVGIREFMSTPFVIQLSVFQEHLSRQLLHEPLHFQRQQSN